MALLNCTIFSAVLGRHCGLNVIIPQHYPPVHGGPRKLLYLLHGRSDDQSDWLRRSQIDLFAEEHDVMVVMPDGERGYFTDMAHGARFFTYLSRELPRIVAELFRVEPDPENTFIAGLSMGGYGALKMAFRHPERFAAAAAFSPVADVTWTYRREEQNPVALAEAADTFGTADGNALLGGPHDLFFLASEAAKAPRRPKLYLACGTSDFLYQDNLRFAGHLKDLNAFDLTLNLEEPDGHAWRFWNRHVERFLEMIAPLKQV